MTPRVFAVVAAFLLFIAQCPVLHAYSDKCIEIERVADIDDSEFSDNSLIDTTVVDSEPCSSCEINPPVVEYKKVRPSVPLYIHFRCLKIP